MIFTVGTVGVGGLIYIANPLQAVGVITTFEDGSTDAVVVTF